MAPKGSNIILIFLSIILFSTTTTISAFNITYLLNNHPEFSTFNDLLTRTGVATAINSRRTITVLVVDNSGMGPISGKPLSTVKYLLATHVILDYYDVTKLGDLSKKTALVITLFQSSGVAAGQQGSLNITTGGGDVIFGSAVKGAPHEAKMVKSVAAQPYNISVIQISQPIVVPGLDQTAPVSPSSSPKASPAPVATPPPKKAKGGKAPTPAAEGPTDEDVAANAPETEGPAAASGPTPVPASAPEDAPADDEPPAKLASPPKNDGARVSVGGAVVAGFMGMMALTL